MYAAVRIVKCMHASFGSTLPSSGCVCVCVSHCMHASSRGMVLAGTRRLGREVDRGLYRGVYRDVDRGIDRGVDRGVDL